MTNTEYKTKEIQERKLDISKFNNIPVECLIEETNPTNYHLDDIVVIHRPTSPGKYQIGKIYSIKATDNGSAEIGIKMISKYNEVTKECELEYINNVFKIIDYDNRTTIKDN